MQSTAPDQASGRQPDFLVIGGMRCGSTTLHNILSAHPQLFLPTDKELHFYDGYNPKIANNVTAYQQIFSEAKTSQMCGEITPDYLTTPQAFENISASFEELKIIVILRDPLERLCSHYRMSCAAGFEVLPFSEAIENENKRLKSRDKIADIFHSYVERSTYYPHIKKYSDRFGKSNVHLIFLEELNEKPKQTLLGMWKFLGINENVDIDVDKLIQPSNESHKLLFANKNFLSRLALRLISLLNLGRKLEPNAPLISEQQKRIINQQFEWPNEQLAKLLGRKLPF